MKLKRYRFGLGLVGLMFGVGLAAQAARPEPTNWFCGDIHVHRSCGGTPEAVSSLYNAMVTEKRIPQRQSPDARPGYPIPGDAATFLADVTIPDDTSMAPYQKFEKTWRIRNSGTVPWVNRWLARIFRGLPLVAVCR